MKHPIPIPRPPASPARPSHGLPGILTSLRLLGALSSHGSLRSLLSFLSLLSLLSIAALAAPPLEVVYIPREDLARAPGRSGAGLFLPLSDLLTLAREAGRPAAPDSRRAPVYCTALELNGRLDNALTLTGHIDFVAPSAGWTAAQIDDGTLPWLAQGSVEPVSPSPDQSHSGLPTTSPLSTSLVPQSAIRNPQFPMAFLARVNQATWLFAKGPGRGRLPVRAMFPAPLRQGEAVLTLGRLDVPSRLVVGLPPEIRLTSATLPVRSQGTDASRTLTLWPTQGKPGRLVLQRQASLTAPSSLRVALDRRVRAIGNAFEVTDQVTLRDAFKSGRSLGLTLPAGLRLLRAEAVGAGERHERATLLATSGTLVLTPLDDMDQLQFRAVFAAELRNGQARPGDWGISALAREAVLTLEASTETEPVLAALPASLRSAAASATCARQYQCDGPLPALAIDLAPARPSLPPRMLTSVLLARGQATAHVLLEVAGTRRRDFLIRLPAEWLLTDLAVREKKPDGFMDAFPVTRTPLSPPLPATVQQLDAGVWSVEWDPSLSPEVVQLQLSRAGAWGAPGSTARLDLPFVRLDGDRPLDNRLTVISGGALDVRPLDLASVVIDASDAGPFVIPPSLQPFPNRLALRVTGAQPAGVLEVRGRDADVRATVVTALTLGEDQARVRALIQYQVSQAPASTFRFRLPAGTGAGVKVSGEGIRESTMRPTHEGEEWTVVTQQKVSGAFPLTLEWTLPGRPGRDAIEAPRIRPLGVTAQQGFIVMESSETLQLKADARNLAETDLAEVPPVPWPRDSRILGAWRYVEPAFSLSIRAEKYHPEPPLGGLVREARLSTSVAPEGARLTRATYTLMPISDRQFFEVRLPGGARLWAVLVDGQGVKPGRTPGAEGAQTLLVPLPAASSHAGDINIEVLYQEESTPLTRASRLALAGPVVGDPVNKTTWKLNLPPGFEYLTYGGSMVNTTTVREPLAAFLRTAYYPDRLVFIGASLAAIIIGTLVLLFVYVVIRNATLERRPRPLTADGASAPDELSIACDPLAENSQPGAPDDTDGGPQPPPIPAREPQPPHAPPPPPRESSGCFGTAFMICLIIGIVLVLAAIAVPNFLEAQTRSKSARVKGDMRTISIAVETYYLDQNSYPDRDSILWQGPIKYLSSEFYDPYAPSPNTPLKYLTGPAAVRAGKISGFFPPDTPDNQLYTYLIYSVGPDQKDDGGMICYDPSNGTTSAGDIIRVKDGVGPAYPAATFNAGRSEESRPGGAMSLAMAPSVAPPEAAPAAAAPASEPGSVKVTRVNVQEVTFGQDEDETKGGPAGKAKYVDSLDLNALAEGNHAPSGAQQGVTYDPSYGSISAGDVYRYKIDGPPVPNANGKPVDKIASYWQGSERSGGNSSSAAKKKIISGIRNRAMNGPANVSSIGARDGAEFAALPPQREAGLLSLGIELPEGGVQRAFETLGSQANIDIRLLAEERFLRWNFIVWVAAFLALSGLWIASPRLWKPGFVAGIGLTLLAPVLFRSAWVVFFNTAFQGILFSAVVPLAAWVLERLRVRFTLRADSTTLLLFLSLTLSISLHSPQARAADGSDYEHDYEHRLRAREGSITTASVTSPTRILVPYDAGRGWDALGKDPLAFIGKSDFTRLWDLAHPAQFNAPKPGAALTELRMEGAFDPETSSIRGTLTLLALNPSDTPTSLPLSLAGLALEGAAADPPGAAIEASPSGLVLRLAAGWSGRVRTPLVLPCESQGSTGRLKIELPEAAAGFWRFDLPWRGAVAEGPSALACVAEATPRGTALTGPVRPGPLDLAWRSGPPAQAGGAAGEGWRCVIDNSLTWTGLTSAAWNGHLTLAVAGAAGTLPPEIRLPLDRRVRLFAASGEGLRATRVSAGDLILTLAPVREASIALQGVVAADADAGRWTIPGLRAPKGVPSLTHLYLYASDELELISLEPQKLERLGAAPARQGFSSRLFQTSDPDWRLALELARPAPAFAAIVRELFLPGAGYLRQAAQIELRPNRGMLSECRLTLPAGMRVTRLEGRGVATWAQSGSTLLATFSPPLERTTELGMVAMRDLAGAESILRLTPLAIQGATETRHFAAMLVSPDSELQELAMAGAVPRVPDDVDRALIRRVDKAASDASTGTLSADAVVHQLYGNDVDVSQVLRAWTLPSDKPLEVRLAPLPANALSRVYNRVTLTGGLQILESTLTAEPRRGRLREVEAILLLGASDPSAASRLQASGHVRHLRTEPAGGRALRLHIELDAPQEKTVSIQLHYDQPADTDSTAPLRLALVAPAGDAGSRAFLLLHSEVEGELAPAGLAGARSVDPAQIGWPTEAGRPQTADRVFELEAAARATPAFTLRRHTRDETLKAFIDVLRHRVILAAGGLERHELEIVLQNQSLQFLKVALPAPRRQVTLYETQVAGRVVKAAFADEGGREVLMIPLIRTGLLDPELAVRVAYTVSGLPPLATRGARRHAMPEVLGGVPVAQSTLILMLPTEFKYSNFGGTLNRVEQVDLEVDETLRATRQLEKLSEKALVARGDNRFRMLSKLSQAKEEAAERLKQAKQTTNAYTRNSANAAPTDEDQNERTRWQRLSGEREQNLKLAEEAASNLASNTLRLAQEVEQKPAPAAPAAPQATPLPATRGWVEFPRSGEVYAFRQLQGTGFIQYEYAAKQTGARRGDVLAALLLTALAALVVTQARRLFATRRRIAAMIIVVCLAAVAAKIALDLTIPGLALGVVLWFGWKPRPPAKRPEA